MARRQESIAETLGKLAVGLGKCDDDCRPSWVQPLTAAAKPLERPAAGASEFGEDDRDLDDTELGSVTRRVFPHDDGTGPRLVVGREV